MSEEYELRLVDIRAGDEEKQYSLGSGYLIAPALVLTARHVVVGARTGTVWARIRVRVGHPHRRGQMERRRAKVCWVDSGGRDVALLELDSPVPVPGAARWGRPRGSDPIPYIGVGYPLHSLGVGGQRTVEQLGGKLPPLAGGLGVDDLYVLDQHAGPKQRPDGKAAWGGVSGTAILCRDLIVGVAVYSDTGHENTRLRAVPAHTFVADPGFIRHLRRHGVAAPVLVPVSARPPVAASGYMLEVEQQFTAVGFEGREAELAEMAAFCRSKDESSPRYWRWLAPAWSGKTTLMAQFALNPPRDVHVLAFFITRRQLGRSDQTAFLASLQGQLREYLHDPDLLCTSQGQFLHALERAAAQATEAGQRLVLLVDGLDEDTGVPDGSSGHSIAALFPRNPPPGLSVLVAARPDPPVPSDVLDPHPLRDAAIDHLLDISPAARSARRIAQRDLTDLWAGPWLGRELACLTAAAGGGLGATDLANMAREKGCDGGVRPVWKAWEVEDALGGSAGRSFQRRPAQWAATGAEPEALFALGHDELHKGVLERLGSGLDAYRARVHAYADTWRDAGWPADTPEYVLIGYPVLLRQLGDTERLTALATDPVRHERLWQITGADAQALSEIGDAFRLHLASRDPDLRACLRLAHRRDALRERASRAADELIMAWAQLGHAPRALALVQATNDPDRLVRLLPQILRFDARQATVALATAAARGIADPEQQAGALRGIAHGLVDAGRTDAARALADALADPVLRARVVLAVVRALADAGRPDEALELAGTVGPLAQRSEALTVAGCALADAGRTEEAEALADVLTDPAHKARVLVGVVRALAEARRPDEAVALAHTVAPSGRRQAALSAAVGGLADAGRTAEAGRLARTLAHPEREAEALTAVARALVRDGRPAEAVALAHDVGRLARNLADPERRARMLTVAACLLADAGSTDDALTHVREAGEVARTLTHPERQAEALEVIAREVATVRRTDDALALSVTGGGRGLQARAVAEVVRVLADAGRTDAGHADAAADLARTIPHPDRKASALVVVARAVAHAGREDDAAALAHEAAAVARSDTNLDRKAQILAMVARALAAAGCDGDAAALADEAAAVARAAKNPDREAETLAAVARTLAAFGRTDEAAAAARAIAHADRRASALVIVARALADAGRTDSALALARTIDKPDREAEALVVAVRALADTGRMEEAAALTRTITVARRQADARVIMARALADEGRTDDALALARTVKDPDGRGQALVGVARALAASGRTDEAVGLARTITDQKRRSLGLVGIVRTLAGAGRTAEALSLSRTITYPLRRSQSLAIIACAVARDGHTANALALARTITHAERRAEAEVGVVHAVADAGRTEEAAALAREIGKPLRRTGALLGIARAGSRAGRTADCIAFAHEAVVVARTVADTESQARLLMDAARTMAEAGATATTVADERGTYIADARAVAAEALSVGRWMPLVEAMAALAPEVLDVLTSLIPEPAPPPVPDSGTEPEEC